MRHLLLVLPLTTACADPAPDPPPTEGTLTLLTYNVHGLPDPLTVTPRPTAERMERIAPLLQPYDVVGLQETFDPDFHAALVAEAPHPHRWWFDAKVASDRVYGSGLGLLSRIEPADYDEVHFTACYGILDGAGDCLASKGFQVASLILGAHVLDVYNTHQEAGRGLPDREARAEQVDQLLAYIETHSAGHAVLLMGDTNLRPSDAEDAALLERFAQAGMRDGCLEVGCPEPDHIDRFLLRDGGGLTLTTQDWSNEPHFLDEDGEALSDHPPLALELAWEGQALHPDR